MRLRDRREKRERESHREMIFCRYLEDELEGERWREQLVG